MRLRNYRSFALIDARVTAAFYWHALEEYPALIDSKPYRWLFMLLLAKPITDELYPGIPVVNHETVARCEGKDPDKSGYTSGPFLMKFSQDVFPLGSLEWNYKTHRARTLSSIPNEEDYLALLDVNTDEYVNFMTGKPWSQDSDKAVSLVNNQVREFIAEVCTKHPARLAITYMNGLASRRFRPDPAGIDEARMILMDPALENTESVQHNLRLVRFFALERPSTPLYGPSVGGCTSRIFTSSKIVQLSQKYRQLLYPDWIDLDLKSCHLAIISVLWGATLIEEYLLRLIVQGTPFWQDILQYLGCGNEMKPRLKNALYATTFGMGRARIVYEGYLSQDLADLFFSHPLVAELVRARNRQIKKIQDQGGDTDCFGKFIALNKQKRGSNALSILSEVAQSYEMALMLSAFEYAMSRTDFTITLFQHDGFSIKVADRRRKKSVIANIIAVVNKECARWGFPTQLEAKNV